MFDTFSLQNNNEVIKKQLKDLEKQRINGMNLDDFIFHKMITKVDPIEYCHRVLRAHLTPNRRYLHENQIALIRAVCNPNVRQVAALMSRQAGKTESIASFAGYLADNYPTMRIGIFTPRIQQAEVSLGRVSVFYQMNEDKLNNEIVSITKDKILLSNNSFISAVSGSDQSNIEGLTFDVIILDEAQKITDYTWSERIVPMGGATNAKLIKIGTPKFRNHFYESFQNSKWTHVIRDWTQCPQLWALDDPPLLLPDHKNPASGELRQYSKFVFNLMPKILKQQYFPNNPEVWTDGEMSVEDFKTQYMLEFVDGAGSFLTSDEIKEFVSGDFDWIEKGSLGEVYYAGIDFAGSDADGADFTHISVIRVTPQGEKQKVWGMEMHGEPYPEQMRIIAKIFGGPSPRFHVRHIFADYTGCGAPVIQTLQMEYGIRNLTGIIFNGADRYSNSGMNMKNIMFAEAKNAISRGQFKYPSKERYYAAAKRNGDKTTFYHKMVEEWADLEYEVRSNSINKRIEAPKGQHDDVCCSDVLAHFATLHGGKSGLGIKASSGRMFSRR